MLEIIKKQKNQLEYEWDDHINEVVTICDNDTAQEFDVLILEPSTEVECLLGMEREVDLHLVLYLDDQVVGMVDSLDFHIVKVYNNAKLYLNEE